MSTKIRQFIFVVVFLIGTVHSYNYHSYEIVNVSDDNENTSDKIEIILENDVNFNSSATKSRQRFITYVNDGINGIYNESLVISRNLFGTTIADVAILNGTAIEVTNRVTELKAFLDSMEKLEKEKSSVNAKFQLIMEWAKLLAKYDISYLRFSLELPTVVDLLFYISLQKNGLYTTSTQIEEKFQNFIENFKPIAADWYSCKKSLPVQDDGFNLWYRRHSWEDWNIQFFSFGDILKLYSKFN